MCDAILGAVRKGGWDGIMLDLHGAMVTRTHEDGEGTLLSRIRAIDAKTPIAVSYDMHANLYPAMVEMPTWSPDTRPIRMWTCMAPGCAPATRWSA